MVKRITNVPTPALAHMPHHVPAPSLMAVAVGWLVGLYEVFCSIWLQKWVPCSHQITRGVGWPRCDSLSLVPTRLHPLVFGSQLS